MNLSHCPKKTPMFEIRGCFVSDKCSKDMNESNLTPPPKKKHVSKSSEYIYLLSLGMFFQDAIALVEKNYSLITWDPNRSPQKDVRCPHRPHGPPHFVVMNEPAFPPLSSWESQGGPPPKKPPHLFHPKKYVACSLRIMVVHMWPPLRVVPQWGKMPLRLHPIG